MAELDGSGLSNMGSSQGQFIIGTHCNSSMNPAQEYYHIPSRTH